MFWRRMASGFQPAAAGEKGAGEIQRKGAETQRQAGKGAEKQRASPAALNRFRSPPPAWSGFWLVFLDKGDSFSPRTVVFRPQRSSLGELRSGRLGRDAPDPGNTFSFWAEFTL
jgi:hypothetical protein